MTSRYHHGDLPNALRAAAADLIDERGPAGFSLREVARRAGVSHAAPAHHFGDTTGLLTSLAVEAFQHLHRALTEAGDGIEDPTDRLRALGKAYVAVGIAHPAHCAVMFRGDLVDGDDEDYVSWGLQAYSVLYECVEEIRATHNADLDVDVAARLCWSAMQGLVSLHANFTDMADKVGATTSPLDETVDAFTDLLLGGLTPR